MLHLPIESKKEEKTVKAAVAGVQSDEIKHVQANIATQTAGNVLLATALIAVADKNGTKVLFRALLDQGSQSAFITENVAQSLRLPRRKIKAIVTGIGAKAQAAKHSIDVTISPHFESEFNLTTEAIILPSLTKIRNSEFDKNDFSFITKLLLADPSFLRNSEIDMILGAAEYAIVIREALVKSEKHLIAQNTELGWIVSGAINRNRSNIQLITLVTNIELEKKLNEFFGVEEFERKNELTEEEIYCEEHFQKTHYRNENGNFVVTIPFKNESISPELGDSRKRAISTQFQLEKRFVKHPKLAEDYKRQIREAIELGHAEEVPFAPNQSFHYIPHHAVEKESTTTALRVVYNASQVTSNGKSLIKFRFFKYAFTSDVEKMYKQILIDEAQLDLQRFVFRFDASEPLKDYRLKTVTFGMANAPYLAIRVLNELAESVRDNYPIATSIILNSMYMDDVLGGCHSFNELCEAYSQLKKTFESARLNLRKWCSNSPEFLEKIPESERELKALRANVKALGIS